MKNILLVGMPGSGKTTIGKMLAKKMKRLFIDVDDFILQQTGQDSAEHLACLGDDRFLDFEEDLTKRIEVENAVIASTGSVPLREKGINHLKKNAIAIWLDISNEILEKRIKKRSDGSTRIIGAHTMTLEEIFAWRKKAFQKNHSIKFKLQKELPKEKVVAKIIEILKIKDTSFFY